MKSFVIYCTLFTVLFCILCIVLFSLSYILKKYILLQRYVRNVMILFLLQTACHTRVFNPFFTRSIIHDYIYN